MKIDQFALWKFKALEGSLKGFSSGDLLTTHVVDKDKNQLDIKYNLQTNEATIVDLFALDADDKIVTCKFKDLINILKERGLYEERGQETRHSSSYIPFTGNLEEI